MTQLPVRPPDPAPPEADFVVVGAGLAGLTAARLLAEKGCSVLVFEARDRVGGRLLSRMIQDGTTIDLGGQWVGSLHNRLRALASSVGVDIFPAPAHRHATVSMGPRRYKSGGLLPRLPYLPRLDLLQAGVRLSRMIHALPLDSPWTARHAAAMDRKTAASWIKKNLLTAEAREYLRTAIEVTFAFEPEDTSLLGLLFDVRAARSLQDLWEGAQSGLLAPGAQEVATRMARQLGDRIRLGHPVHSIIQKHERVLVSAGSATISCNAVAVCIPPNLSCRLNFTPSLPPLRQRLLAGLPPGNAIKFVATYRQPVWQRIADNSSTINSQSMIAVTADVTPPNSSTGILVGLAVGSGATRLRRLAAPARGTAALTELADVLGPAAMKADSVHLVDWSDEEWTGGCYAAHFVPGLWTTAGHLLREPVGRVHWGGTETAHEWHGYMEGAVRSGERLAAELLHTYRG
ncbi:MAG: FAD-dependent oxidoreductase [Actinomycetota bacterium]|nr:FAD-dependent oxidoreductase [Actinomycetota bacterium]MDQ6944990.1 FAD-dependent oxidoreductase [Actinomycetota bacterium]